MGKDREHFQILGSFFRLLLFVITIASKNVILNFLVEFYPSGSPDD